MKSSKGRFITFEGIDRCGKTTQARALKQQLDKFGARCLLTAEPGGAGQLGSALRSLLLDSSIARSEITAALLFSADRHEHVSQVIEPALREGRWVICDRYVDSTIAYQGGGGNVDMDLLHHLADIASRGIMPDLTVLLTIDADKRAKRNPKLDYYDQGKSSFESRVTAMFMEVAERNKERFFIVDGDQDVKAIAAQVFAEVQRRFQPDES